MLGWWRSRGRLWNRSLIEYYLQIPSLSFSISSSLLLGREECNWFVDVLPRSDEAENSFLVSYHTLLTFLLLFFPFKAKIRCLQSIQPTDD